MGGVGETGGVYSKVGSVTVAEIRNPHCEIRNKSE